MADTEYQRKYRENPEVRKKYQALNKRWYSENPSFVMYRNAKKRSKDLGIEFDIDWREITIPETCPLLGIPLIIGEGKLHDNSPSLDRIDSTKGYTKDNVWVVSFRANSIKRNATIDEFATILNNWRNKLGDS